MKASLCWNVYLVTPANYTILFIVFYIDSKAGYTQQNKDKNCKTPYVLYLVREIT